MPLGIRGPESPLSDNQYSPVWSPAPPPAWDMAWEQVEVEEMENKEQRREN